MKIDRLENTILKVAEKKVRFGKSEILLFRTSATLLPSKMMLMQSIFFSTEVTCTLGVLSFFFVSINVEEYPFLISTFFGRLSSLFVTFGLQILRIYIRSDMIRFRQRVIRT